jgi:hypothetical protein
VKTVVGFGALVVAAGAVRRTARLRLRWSVVETWGRSVDGVSRTTGDLERALAPDARGAVFSVETRISQAILATTSLSPSRAALPAANAFVGEVALEVREEENAKIARSPFEAHVDVGRATVEDDTAAIRFGRSDSRAGTVDG